MIGARVARGDWHATSVVCGLKISRYQGVCNHSMMVGGGFGVKLSDWRGISLFWESRSGVLGVRKVDRYRRARMNSLIKCERYGRLSIFYRCSADWAHISDQ